MEQLLKKQLRKIAVIALVLVWAPSVYVIYTNFVSSSSSRWLGWMYANKAENAFYSACGITIMIAGIYWLAKLIASVVQVVREKTK